jgi:hypothetical protein
MLLMDFLNKLLFRNTLFSGADHNRRTVSVVGANVNAPLPAELLEPHPDIGLDVFDQMSNMDRPVGVGQGRGDQDLASLAHQQIRQLKAF